MDESSDIANRSRIIADIIREYSKSDVDREWLLNKNKDMDNVFKRSFYAIRDYTGDFDISLWYIAFSQTFAKRFDVMLDKIANMCIGSDKEVITFKKDVPAECPYRGLSDKMIEEIFKIDFNKSNEEIRSEIRKICRSEKKFHTGKWCNQKAFGSCEYRNECPVSEWKKLINRFNLPLRNESKIFFYYDTLCLLNNKKISNFNELISALDSFTSDKTKKTIIIRTILEQVRGIDTKTLLFLQDEKHFNERDFDELELIFTDRLARRVAERIKFPFYQNDWADAIKKFGETYNLNARQIDRALWETGFICTAEGCLHGDNEKSCIFHAICSWEGKR